MIKVIYNNTLRVHDCTYRIFEVGFTIARCAVTGPSGSIKLGGDMAGIIENRTFNTDTFIGSEIDNITIMELIGRGAMGAVFVGYQKSLKRKVAVKVFPRDGADDARGRVHFREEAETVAVLNHPNIVQIIDMGATADCLFIVMQMVQGEDLRTMIHRYQRNPIPARRLIDVHMVLSIMLPVLDALAYAHEEGVVHQDIKPGNILIEERSNRPYLADFGIARSAMSEESDSDIIVGTPLYIAPEQIREEQCDSRSDIYSAGIVLFEALAGKLPFEKNNMETLLSLKMNNPDELFSVRPSRFCPAIDGDMERIILKAAASRKGERYQNCRAFHHELSQYYARRYGGGVQ